MNLVGLAGIEPATHGLKVRYNSTLLQAHVRRGIHSTPNVICYPIFYGMAFTQPRIAAFKVCASPSASHSRRPMCLGRVQPA